MGPWLSSLLRFRLWVVVLLAAIGLQASEPIRAPFEVRHGSAFSSATVELALLTSEQRGETSVAKEIAIPPAPLPMAIEGEQFLLATAEPNSTPRLRPEARGPPPRSHSARLPDSTAPPFA